MKRLAVIVFLLLPLVATGVWLAWRAHRPRPPVPYTAALQRPAPLPAPARCGATGRSEVEHFNRSTIYMWLDGGAEPYLEHGFVRSSLATYHFSAAGGHDLSIEAAAVVFASPAGAAAQATAETPPDAQPVPGLPGAIADRDVLVLHRGPQMLHLVSFTPALDARPELKALATAWLRGGR